MKYKLQKGLIVQKIDGKITIFDGEESMLYTFNETASYIFSKIKAGWEKEKIIASLAKKYCVSSQKAAKDVTVFLEDLKKYQIINRV